MKVDNTQQLLQLELMSQLFNSGSSSDDNGGGGFQMVMDTLLNAMQGNGTQTQNPDAESLDVNGIGTNNVSGNITTGNASIDSAVSEASQKYGVDKKFILGVINQESGFNSKAVSSAGAEGLMQLMPQTAQGLGVTNPFDINQNVDGGTKYLKELLDMYGNSKEMALAAYNAGPGAVNVRGMHNPGEVYKMPQETQNYVKRIMQYYNNSK